MRVHSQSIIIAHISIEVWSYRHVGRNTMMRKRGTVRDSGQKAIETRWSYTHNRLAQPNGWELTKIVWVCNKETH